MKTVIREFMMKKISDSCNKPSKSTPGGRRVSPSQKNQSPHNSNMTKMTLNEDLPQDMHFEGKEGKEELRTIVFR